MGQARNNNQFSSIKIKERKTARGSCFIILDLVLKFIIWVLLYFSWDLVPVWFVSAIGIIHRGS